MTCFRALLPAILSAAALALAAQDRPPTAPGTKVRVAAISFVPAKFGLQSNAAGLERLFREAAAGGAKIALAPEGVLEGYVVK